MQAAGDIFLSWPAEAGLDDKQPDFYIRQLRDWKFSMLIEIMAPRGMRIYGQVCGWTLARAHARSGDRIAIAACLGSSGTRPSPGSPPPAPTRTSATANRSWTPSPRDGSPPNPTCKIPAAAALTGELSGHMFPNLTLM